MIDPMATYKNDSLINTITCYQYSAYFLFEINNILKMTIVFTLKNKTKKQVSYNNVSVLP